MFVLSKLYKLNLNPAGCQLDWHWAVPLHLAEGSVARKQHCAWSGLIDLC